MDGMEEDSATWSEKDSELVETRTKRQETTSGRGIGKGLTFLHV
jgi:hypothetical protein